MDGKLGEANSGQCYCDLYIQSIIPGNIQLLVWSFFTLMGLPLTAKVTLNYVRFCSQLLCSLERSSVIVVQEVSWVMSPIWNVDNHAPWILLQTAPPKVKVELCVIFKEWWMPWWRTWERSKLGKIVNWRRFLWNFAGRGLLSRLSVLWNLSSMTVSKEIDSVAAWMDITIVWFVIIDHATVSLMILTTQILSAHFLTWTQSTTSVTTVPTMPFMNSQFTGLMMPSTAFRWGKIHMAHLCVLLLMLCILYSTASSFTALTCIRKGSAMIHWQNLAEWQLPLTRHVVEEYNLVFCGLISHLELQTSPRSSAPNSLALSYFLQPLQCKLRDGMFSRGTSQTLTLLWEQWNASFALRLGWISWRFGMSIIQPVRLTRLKLHLLLWCIILCGIFRKIRAANGWKASKLNET